MSTSPSSSPKILTPALSSAGAGPPSKTQTLAVSTTSTPTPTPTPVATHSALSRKASQGSSRHSLTSLQRLGSNTGQTLQRLGSNLALMAAAAVAVVLPRRQALSPSARAIETRLQKALQALVVARRAREQKRLAAGDAEKNPRTSFDAVILRFPVMHRAFLGVGEVFARFDEDHSGTIDENKLARCMRAFGAPIASVSAPTPVSPSESVSALPGQSEAAVAEGQVSPALRNLFNYAHRIPTSASPEAHAALTFKEFLLALAVSTILHLFPDSGLRVNLLGGGGSDIHIAADKAAAAAAMAAEQEAAALHAMLASGLANPGGRGGRVGGRNSVIGSGPSPLSSAMARYDSLVPSAMRAAVSSNDEDTALFAIGRQFAAAVQLMIDCYFLFDQNGRGTISREEVLAIIDDEVPRGSSASLTSKNGPKRRRSKLADNSANALLSRERWEDVDWDLDNTISFKDFVFAVFKWVGLDDDDEPPSSGLGAVGGAGEGVGLDEDEDEDEDDEAHGVSIDDDFGTSGAAGSAKGAAGSAKGAAAEPSPAAASDASPTPLSRADSDAGASGAGAADHM